MDTVLEDCNVIIFMIVYTYLSACPTLSQIDLATVKCTVIQYMHCNITHLFSIQFYRIIYFVMSIVCYANGQLYKLYLLYTINCGYDFNC